MNARRTALTASLVATALSCFTLGLLFARRIDAIDRASYEAKLEAIRAELRHELGRDAEPDLQAAGTSGRVVDTSESDSRPARTGESALVGAAEGRKPLTFRARMAAEITRELQAEMGLLPVSLFRQRRASFVELYATDHAGKTSYGTAGHLGRGYFITVKHAVVALGDPEAPAGSRRIESIKLVYKGEHIPASVVDAGDADVEVDPGDWAIIKSREVDLPALQVDTGFGFEFADPIFRLGNDYSKGIVVSTGYVGQRTAAGLITCLTDGHPGVSGGGVLDQRGMLVGIPIGRMQGDYRFSFILPMRVEMLRKVPVDRLARAAAPGESVR
jgi:hypothetical protein